MMTDMDNEDILLDDDDDILLAGMDMDMGGMDDGDFDSSLAELMAEANAFLGEDVSDQLDQALQTMESTQMCVSPQHSHSFAKVTFTLGASLRKCAGCGQGFKAASVFGTSAAENNSQGPADASIVKCVACGAVAHRSCAFDPNLAWAEPCPVNSPSVQEASAATDAKVVTDDEEDVGQDYEVELNDNVKDNEEQGEQQGGMKRNKSFMSNSNSDDESMESQDLEEEELLGTAELKLEDPEPEEERDCATPPPETNNGVARRTISNLLFSRRKEEGADISQDAGKSDSDNQEEKATTTTTDTNSQNETGDDAPLTPNTGRKRTWFGKNSPVKSQAKGKAGGGGEEESNLEDSQNGSRTRLGWFNRKASKENETANANADAGEDNLAAAQGSDCANGNNSESQNSGANSSTPRAPWLSSVSTNGVEEDYGEEFNGIAKAPAPAAAPPIAPSEVDDQPGVDTNTAGRRGWFQRRQNTAPEPASNDPSPTPTARGFGFFAKKTPQRELDTASGKQGEGEGEAAREEEENAVEEDAEVAPEVEVEAEFDEFLDVEEDESKKPAPVTAESARADFDDFLDLSDDSHNEKDNSHNKESQGDVTTTVDAQEGGAEGEIGPESAKADFGDFLDLSDGDNDNKESPGGDTPTTGDAEEGGAESAIAPQEADDEVNNAGEDKRELQDDAVDETKIDVAEKEDAMNDNGVNQIETVESPPAEEAKVCDTTQSETAGIPPQEDKDIEDSKTTEPPPEERKGLLGFGLFARKSKTDEQTEEADATKTELLVEDVQSQQNPAEGDNPSTPLTSPKPRFRLFARKGEESASNNELPDAPPITDAGETPAEASPRRSFWKKTPSNTDSQGDREAAFKDESNTIDIIEEANEANSANQATTSLFSRVFTPKNKAEDEGDNNLEEKVAARDAKETEELDDTGPRRFGFFSAKKVADVNKEDNKGEDEAAGDDVATQESDDNTPRRFGLFSARKVADANNNEAEDAESDNKAETSEEAAKTPARKFTLFGFRRSANEEEEDANAHRNQSWASDEPPSHWATATTATFQSCDDVGEDCEDKEEGKVEEENVPLHYANHPFASVSRALQENILALLSDDEKKTEEENCAVDDKQEDTATAIPPIKPKSLSMIVSPDITDPPQSNDAALGEVKPEPVQESTLLKVASGTYEAVKATALAQKKLGMASVAGSIAGGVAGLMFAGPAGVFMGVEYGRAAGALGVVLEGSITVGVIVAGVAGGRFTAERIQEQIKEQRVLTIGENGITRKVMLVRPTINIDPAWHSICAEAQRTSPSSSASAFSLFTATDTLKQDRYERTSDICEEDDIPTEEKVLLLVSRVLSDKDSFPGHVYRCLMQAFKDRCKQRDELRIELAKNREDFPHLFEGDSADPESANKGAGGSLSLSPRGRREDAHGVIKYITGTLLEVRPGLGSTPETTETTASVVEALVFGEVYDLVYEEIALEATEKDKNLIEKIDDFEYARLERTGKPLPSEGVVSQEAITALKRLPETHAAVDKLRFGVVFLEKLSDHFAASVSDTAMGADSLLKMVCQHVIIARMPCVNAEVAFLEEFARDEQLLRGKEGYALVTLQAALHFLNMSIDFERDIFGQDNDEENVPIGDPVEGEEALPDDKKPSNDEATEHVIENSVTMPPNAEAQSTEIGEQAPDLENGPSTSDNNDDKEIVAESEQTRDEKKEDAPVLATV